MAVGIVGALLLGTAAAAPAALADVEPNGAVFMAEGPIFGGQDIQGTVGPADTDDWYVFHVDGAHQLHLTSAQLTGPGSTQGGTFGSCASAELTNANGSRIPSDFTSDSGESTFYVHVWQANFIGCQADAGYRFRVDPAAAVVTGPGKLPIKGTAEPNDSRATAGGPLVAGAWYHSELETANDSDWLRFYVRPGTRRVDVQTVVYGAFCATHEVTLRSARGRELTSYIGTRGTIAHLLHRPRGGARLYVEIVNGALSLTGADSCIRSATVVQVGPEEAIMSAAEVKQGCADARRATRRNARRVVADERALARAAARGAATGQLRRKLRRDLRGLRRSRGLVAAYCSR
ncbi:MAG TPA: hypothetical protein VHF90_08875 [Thermoleophilaceae bacterium]|nr:hypothetical protein [Thermoleophilaceae bacterium]